MLPGIGVFGTGAVTKVLVPVLKEKKFQIKAIWGRSIKEAEETARELGITFYTNKIDDVLLRKDVDLVFIICPPYLHAEISVKALGIGKHVVCDKPMGLGKSDALKMVRASQYYPTLISLVNHSLRFLPTFTQLKRAIDDNFIGPTDSIVLIDIRVQMGSLIHKNFDWTCDASMGGGTLNLIGSHVIDLVTFLIGKRALRVHGILRTYTKTTSSINGIRQITAPDFCNFQMELEGNTLVTSSLHSHHTSPDAFFQEVLVYGKNGYLSVREGNLFINRNSYDNNCKEEAIYIDVPELSTSTLESSLPRPYIRGICEMMGALKEAFSQKENTWAKEPVKAAANFEDGLYVQAVIEAIKKSSVTRNWTKVDLSTESPNNHERLMRFAGLSAM